jgi:hypothetical protein
LAAALRMMTLARRRRRFLLAFKKQFTELLVDHCRRKPLSQRGTWLEGLCRDTSPSAWTAKLADAITAAPFAE